MKRLLPLILALFSLPGFAAAPAGVKSAISAKAAIPGSETLEKELQNLTWPQFRFVVQSIPKLKAKVDAYGPTGWRYVQSRYQTYAWRNSIEKFTPEERKKLHALINQARKN